MHSLTRTLSLAAALLPAAAGFAQNTPAGLSRYVGQYRLAEEPDVVLSIEDDGGKLYVEGTRRHRTELEQETPGLFHLKSETAVRFQFVADRAGAITGLKFGPAEAETQAEKIRDTPVPNRFRPYSRQEAMIPMRDGVKLHAVILRPTDTHEPLPFLLQRTPYGVSDNTPESIGERLPELAQSGYIFVLEDIRGRYGSEGRFVMMRPMADHSDPKQVDESTDAYDTVAWLLRNVPENNGRVGVSGISYTGFLAIEAGIDPHPAVKAISPQAPMTDVWIGDDFFHNGTFRQTYGYDYVLGMESSKENSFAKMSEDAYAYFLKAGSFASAARAGGTLNLPTTQAFLAHPAYDAFWQSRAVEPHLKHAAVPTLEVGGWWDQEDMWGPQAEYAALEPEDREHQVFLALGPWNHGQWASTTRHLGQLDFGAATGDQFRKEIEAPFFAHYLKDEPGFRP